MEQPDLTTVTLSLDIPGKPFEAFGWTDLKVFMEAFVKALQAMPGGPSPRDVLPIKLAEGSVRPTVRLPDASRPAVNRLQRGPQPNWTKREREGSDDLWTFLEKHRARLSLVSRGRLKPFISPAVTPDTITRSFGSYAGVVLGVWGVDGQVEIDFELLGKYTCSCGGNRTLAKKLAAWYQERVSVSGLLMKTTDGVLKSFTLSDANLLPPRLSLSEALAEYHRKAGPEMVGFDPVAALKELGR